MAANVSTNYTSNVYATDDNKINSLINQYNANSAKAWDYQTDKNGRWEDNAKQLELRGANDAIAQQLADLGVSSSYDAYSGQTSFVINKPEQKQPRQSSGGGGYDLSDYLRQQKAAQTEAELARLQGAYEKSMRGYEDQQERLPETYATARNNLAAQRAVATRNFDERAVAAGLNTGTAGQAMLARDNAYLGGIAGINSEEANALSDLELTKANLTTDYESAIAQAQNNGDAELASALYQELIRVQNLERDDAEIARSEAQRAQELALKYGLADPTGLSSIQSLSDLANMRSGAATYDAGTASAGGNGLTGGTLTGSTVDNGSLTAAQIKEMQQYYGVTADGLWGKNSKAAAGGLSANEAWAKYQREINNPATQVTSDYGSVLPSLFTPNADVIPSRGKLDYSQDEGVWVWNGKRYGSFQALLNDMDAAGLTEAEKRALERSFDAYGKVVSFS